MNINELSRQRLAYIISSHGYGHAARACAVMNSIKDRFPGVEFDIFTFAPEWFFAESIEPGYRYIPFDSDVGVVQLSPLSEDLPATVELLKSSLPFEGERVRYLANRIKTAQYGAVLCDIAPLGIAASQQAGVPAVLIENFTWDWIYSGYLEIEPRLSSYIQPLREVFEACDYRIRTRPLCGDTESDLTVGPVARKPRLARAEMRRKLGIAEEDQVVLVTMGGIQQTYSGVKQLTSYPEYTFILPGSGSQAAREQNLILLPHHHPYYHPDLVEVSDAVVGKLGYSTIAESYHANRPYGFIARNHFRETGPLAEFVCSQMNGLEIAPDQFEDGSWAIQLPDLLSKLPAQHHEVNGADDIAEFLGRTLGLVSVEIKYA